MNTMIERLRDDLAGKQADYNMPFLWMHGEDHETLRRELDRIYDSGIRGVCVESRPHENFCRAQWWSDMDLILSRCQELGMQVWLLDDKHFPTGYANGAIDEKYPHLRKKCVAEKHTDVRGPVTGGAVILPELTEDNELISVVACRRVDDPHNQNLTGEFMDLTARVSDGLVFFDLPEGVYRIFTFYTKTVTDQHMDTMNPDSVDVLINEVYETHYAHYKDYFGNVFQGFFSDEPFLQRDTVLALRGDYAPKGMTYPWNDLLREKFSEKLGEDCRKYLPAIWAPTAGVSPKVRTAYMDAVTELYNTHFNKRVADWCHAHGVRYIGHIIEDANNHSSFWAGGHYFRALDDMDMAGIDVVLCQIVPGLQDHIGCVPCSYDISDPDFFSFGLAKLASSHAHIQPKKNGTAMCEMFGAYGWAEGLKMMKWLVDHMIVRGINRFVPHAFSMKPNDPDCPPHFYANGENPQYPAFRLLMEYADRQIHLTTAGRPVCGSALLYHAEAEWSGGQYMYFQQPARALTEAQLEFDILSCDYLLTGVAENGKLRVNDCRFDCLIVPMAEYLPRNVLEKMAALATQGVKILWIDEKTVKATDGLPFVADFGAVVPFEKLTAEIRENIGWDIRLKNGFRQLRYSHRTDDGTDLYMLFNEHVDEAFAGEIEFSADHGTMLEYDAYTGKLTRREDRRITLEPYETRFIIFTDEPVSGAEAPELPLTETVTPALQWEITLEGATCRDAALFNVAQKYPRFGGTITYRTRFPRTDARVLDLGNVGETAEVILNGVSLGTRIAPPYRFDMAGLLREENTLQVNVTTHLGYNRRDRFSSYLLLEPMGLLGPVTLKK